MDHTVNAMRIRSFTFGIGRCIHGALNHCLPPRRPNQSKSTNLCVSRVPAVEPVVVGALWSMRLRCFVAHVALPVRRQRIQSGKGMNSESPATIAKRLCCQSNLARSMRSRELDTKFHQTCLGPTGVPPMTMTRQSAFAVICDAGPGDITPITPLASRCPSMAISPETT